MTFLPPFSNVTAPAPDTDGMLNENACGDPTCGWPRRLKRMRSIAWASVAVPTVEREFAPIRSWSTMIAGLTFSSASTSGRFELPHELLHERRVRLVDEPLRLVRDRAEDER